MKERNIKIDLLKTITIILVILGHLVVFNYPNNYNTNILFKVCYSFHMPLFIFISGYLVGYKSLDEIVNIKWIKKRCSRLLIPYFTWTIISCIINNKYNIINSLFVEPKVWFLINLFLYDLTLFLSFKILNKKKYLFIILVFIISFICYLIFKDSNLVIKNFVMFYVFYFTAYYVKENEYKVKKYKKILKFSIILYPLSMIIFTYKEYDILIPCIKKYLSININDKIVYLVLLLYNHIIVAFLGILFVWIITGFVCKYYKKYVIKLSFIGKYTMHIYLIESFLNFNFVSNIIINNIVLFVIKLVIPILIGIVFSKFPKISKFFFG